MSVGIPLEVDVPFHTHENGELLATLYRPAGKTVAAVAEVHGGAWTSGNRSGNAEVARHLADHGIAVLSLDFRMPPEAAYPVTVSDVGAGLHWLKSHAAELGITPAKAGLLGTSSGGHLALLTALRPDDPRYAGTFAERDPDFAAGFAVLGWPVSDPLARYRMVHQRNNTRLIEAHHAFWADEAAMTEGSPFAIVERGDAQRLPSLLILQGTNDDNLTPDMQHRFVDAYRAKGGRVELDFFEGQPHSFISRDPASAASSQALAQMTSFILRESASR